MLPELRFRWERGLTHLVIHSLNDWGLGTFPRGGLRFLIGTDGEKFGSGDSVDSIKSKVLQFPLP